MRKLKSEKCGVSELEIKKLNKGENKNKNKNENKDESKIQRMARG